MPFISTKWLNELHNLKYLVLGSSTTVHGPYVTIELSTPLFSLQEIEIKTVSVVIFEGKLCHTFPSLNSVVISDANINLFPRSLALHDCLFLKTLDLSGSISDINLKHLNISIPSLEELTLARNELTSIEQILFVKAPNLTSLNLTDNKIQIIGTVIATAFKHLIDLSINGNDVVSLSGIEGLTYLKHLNAARNQITDVLPCLTSNGPVLMTLDLSNNPFSCTCDIEHFRKWIISDQRTWLQPGIYNCATPKSLKGVSISAIKLDCRSHTAFYLGISIPSAIVFCMIIVCLILYRWHIKYKLFLLYRNYHPFPDINDNFEMLPLGLQYHAYIAYNENSDDDAWVMNDLQPNMEEGPEPVKLCIKRRDFIPGHSLIESISENIRRSCKTIIVLSPNFVESNWCLHEMEIAKIRFLDENLDVIILVLLGEIPHNKMILSLHHLLCKKDYLKWPNDRAGQRLFWQRLRQEIKEPSQVDHRFCM